MPKVSKRGLITPASPIRKLVPFAERAKARGIEIFHLNIGQPDIKTPELGLKAVQEAELEVLEYSHSAGFLSYRQKLAAFYQQYDIELQENELIITNGGSEALLFGMLACLDHGDEIIIPEPFYANYNGFASSLGIVIRPIATSIDNDFALPPIEAFESKINERTRAILICHPGNPTGYLYSKEELESLGEIVKKHDLFLFADEVYRDFCYDGKKHTSVLTLDGLDQHVVMIDSVSKRYSACGARIGVLATRNQELYKAAMKFAQARLSPSTYGQILGEALTETPADYFKTVHEEYDQRRQLVVQRLQKMQGVICPNPGGAFYTMIQLPVDDTDKFCQWLLESFDHHGKTVMMAPGSGFYTTEGLGKQQARIAYVLNKEDLNEAMDCLEAALQIYPGRFSLNTEVVAGSQ